MNLFCFNLSHFFFFTFIFWYESTALQCVLYDMTFFLEKNRIFGGFLGLKESIDQAITLATNVKRSPVELDDLKLCLNSEKNSTFLRVINKPIIYKILKHFTNTIKETNNPAVSSHNLYKSWDSFKHIEKISQYE